MSESVQHPPRMVDAPVAEPVASDPPPREERARLSGYRKRFNLLYIALALVTGIAVGAFIVVARERDRAQAAEVRASAVNDFLVHELLRATTPEKAQGRTLTVAEVLDNASRSVAHAFRDQPETEAEIRLTLAGTYAALGRPRDARGHAAVSYTHLTLPTKALV